MRVNGDEPSRDDSKRWMRRRLCVRRCFNPSALMMIRSDETYTGGSVCLMAAFTTKNYSKILER